MRAKELIPILAEIYGVSFEAAFMIDRSLSEGELRAKGRGRSLPEMSRVEAIRFLIAAMTNQKPTKAAEELRPWLEARSANFEPTQAIDLLEGELDDTIFVRKRLWNSLIPLAASLSKDGEYGPVDLLIAYCHRYECNQLHELEARVVCDISNDWLALEFRDLQGSPVDAYYFYISGSSNKVNEETGIHRSVYVYGEALLAIIHRTEDPLSEVVT